MVLSQGKLYFSKDPEGVQHFLGGGGVQMLISIEIHITCDFPRGGGVHTCHCWSYILMRGSFQK